MKLILLPALLLLLASCTQYRYDVTYEKCNGQTGSLNYEGGYSLLDGNADPYITYNNGLIWKEGRISQICDFSYTRNEIK